jgi:hypothetical protein
MFTGEPVEYGSPLVCEIFAATSADGTTVSRATVRRRIERIDR